MTFSSLLYHYYYCCAANNLNLLNHIALTYTIKKKDIINLIQYDITNSSVLTTLHLLLFNKYHQAKDPQTVRSRRAQPARKGG